MVLPETWDILGVFEKLVALTNEITMAGLLSIDVYVFVMDWSDWIVSKNK